MSNSNQSNPNRLVREKSPYLKQHQFNPVDWYPWSDEAFQKAKTEEKPIFLSIGYSTCHWCHVMEKESFEDPFVATLMNQAFVNIKVDREERPDIDQVYMTVCQMMTGHGGWPLTIIMTPDQKPFFAGTYIPKTTKHGHLGMVDLIPRVQELWKGSRGKVLETSQSLVDALSKSRELEAPQEVSAALLHRAFEFHDHSYDLEWGGFGSGPKFPSLHHLQFLFRYGERFQNKKAKEMALMTLRHIVAGGIYDHVGGGIHRYSVDGEWFVPHFEKMLYDQAMLISILSEAYLLEPDFVFEQALRHTIEYTERDLSSVEGAFYCGEDADSEGEEGKFYIWKREEFLDITEDKALEKEFDLQEPGNFTEQGQVRDGNILRFSAGTHERWLRDENWSQARRKLLHVRSKRPRPLRDSKMLTDWNAMMVSALARASRVLGETHWAQRADRALTAIETHLFSDGKLMHRYCEGEVKYNAHLDDYAYLLEAYIEMYGTRFDTKYLEKARALAREMVEHFWDEKDATFYFTSDESETLIVRKKEFYDGAYPSGNSIALLNLLKLSHLIGDTEFEDKALAGLKVLSGNMEKAPGAHAALFCALDFSFGPNREFVVVGEDALAQQSIRVLHTKARFCDLTHWKKSSDQFKSIAVYLNELEPIDGEPTLFVCENFACKSPQKITREIIEKL